nr:hypothetical protein MACL_00003118 [Theileria orientalis]
MEEFEEERIGIHKSVNLHAKRLITSYYSILESCQIDITRDSILRTQVDNFQVKLHNDAFLHSARSLYTIASDLAINWLLHTPKLLDYRYVEARKSDTMNLYDLREKIRQNDELLDRSV